MGLQIPAHLVIPGDRVVRSDGSRVVVVDKKRYGLTLNEQIELVFGDGSELLVKGSKLIDVEPR